MGQHTNIEIAQAYKGSSGQGKYGPYQFYDLYFSKDGKEGTQKFQYCHSGKKIVPKVGMKIALMDFTPEPWESDGKSGKNYKIDKLELAEGQEAPKSSPEAQNAPQGAKYGKDNGRAYMDQGEVILRCMEMAGGASCDGDVLETLIELFKDGLEMLLDDGGHNDLSSPISDEDPGLSDDDIPF